MITSIDFIKFRKLQNLTIEFNNGINAISGTNGTCKSSILYLISNAFQAPKQKQNPEYKIIKDLNDSLNPKIETITKGDKKYNDPAKDIPGRILQIHYQKFSLNFRRINQEKGLPESRFRVGPTYATGKKESLPHMPVVYLGISRLMPFGELPNEQEITTGPLRFIPTILEEFNAKYHEFTGIKVAKNDLKHQKIKGVKQRDDFSSELDGVDSNTISAGEDNIRIILKALYSLKQYYQSRFSSSTLKPNQVESVLVIDEFDATLHPSLQVKLIDLIEDFSAKYKIQVFFSTHSMYLLNHLLAKKCKITYLINQSDHVMIMDAPNMMLIEAHLREEVTPKLYTERYIPILTEDAEARLFLRVIFDYFREYKTSFKNIRSYFHLVEANIGSEVLQNLFTDKIMSRTTMNAICILDGDQSPDNSDELSLFIQKNMICLPGNANPEQVIYNYLEQSIDNNDFWKQHVLTGKAFTKYYYITNLQPKIHEINDLIEKRDQKQCVEPGQIRKKQKALFREYQEIIEVVFNLWVSDKNNYSQLEAFYNQLYSVFKRVSNYNGIDSNFWNKSLD